MYQFPNSKEFWIFLWNLEYLRLNFPNRFYSSLNFPLPFSLAPIAWYDFFVLCKKLQQQKYASLSVQFCQLDIVTHICQMAEKKEGTNVKLVS